VLGQRHCEAADLGVADGLLAAGASGQVAPGQARKGRVAQGLAGSPAIGVVTAQQQGTQPAALRVAGHRELRAGNQQDAQRLPVAVSPWHRHPGGVQAQRGQHRQVRIDRAGLALPPALLAAGCSHSITSSPAAASARASPIP
jgi:hypothetical protein